ncbi:hypothetical protein CAPTEDRAFT_108484 [Capitella teleta]|uniref:Uncharacterized protein n=1 Tax=Capitella teleta TaxID=283909 RepID=R7U0S8_CAPTE|nr:hypothetical protein CAPTEDRAFT_108484 [Capitella teleta]|eukprot:ELT99477.1 hypothetical protein CAPTEDRAFT_108484 [Capitella teleta]
MDQPIIASSRKHANFVSEPMAAKPVTALAGIGETLGRKLNQHGYQQARDVLGKYLTEGPNFEQWLKDSIGANANQASTCRKCLQDWSDNFI